MCEVTPYNGDTSPTLLLAFQARREKLIFAMLCRMRETGGKARRLARLKVSVSPAERAAIEDRAVATGHSLSSLLRNLALGFEPKAILDLQAIQTLVTINADQGRLGGLLKLWLMQRPGEGAETSDVRRVLQEIEANQAELRRLVQRL
jgi:hypothetical protein